MVRPVSITLSVFSPNTPQDSLFLGPVMSPEGLPGSGWGILPSICCSCSSAQGQEHYGRLSLSPPHAIDGPRWAVQFAAD